MRRGKRGRLDCPGEAWRAGGGGARAYLAQLPLQLQGAQHNGAANGVLHPPNARVHGVQRQHLFLYPCHCSLAVTCSQGHDPAQTRQEGGSGGGTVRKWGEGNWIEAQWPGWGGGLKIRGCPLHYSLLAPLKGTEKAGGGAGDAGPPHSSGHSSAPGSHREWVRRQAGLGARPGACPVSP